MKRDFKCAFWRITLFAHWLLGLVWFADRYLAFGIGICWLWLLLYCINFFYGLLFLQKDKRWRILLGCNLLIHVIVLVIFHSQFVGALNAELKHVPYNRMSMGYYSYDIPVNAWDISYRRYAAFLSSGGHVECKVKEKDFLWFCYRNGYHVRSDLQDLNERTGIRESSFGGSDAAVDGRFYAYNYIFRNGGGTRLYYDCERQKMILEWSTN